ncbi:hypothetical protein WJ12_05620 [Burkholderia seminalis]|nr:hypothetical protein WJ12_05620 [Burkholderia seminalis]
MLLRNRIFSLVWRRLNIDIQVFLRAGGSKRQVQHAKLLFYTININILVLIHLKQQAIRNIMLPNGRCFTTNLPTYVIVRKIFVFDQFRNILSLLCRLPLLDTSDVAKTEIGRNILPVAHFDIRNVIEETVLNTPRSNQLTPLG